MDHPIQRVVLVRHGLTVDDRRTDFTVVGPGRVIVGPAETSGCQAGELIQGVVAAGLGGERVVGTGSVIHTEQLVGWRVADIVDQRVLDRGIGIVRNSELVESLDGADQISSTILCSIKTSLRSSRLNGPF
jgi:hypothetical protein